MEKLSHNLNLGYIFYPPVHSGSPGHPHLDIIISAIPSQAHFDPEFVDIFICSDENLEQLNVCHPWTKSKNYKLCPGRVRMTDRHGKVAEAFSFGGSLNIETREENTTCILSSPAPILPFILEVTTSFTLAQEIEVLLAERRAKWADDLDAYGRCLTLVEPIPQAFRLPPQAPKLADLL